MTRLFLLVKYIHFVHMYMFYNGKSVTQVYYAGSGPISLGLALSKSKCLKILGQGQQTGLQCNLNTV